MVRFAVLGAGNVGKAMAADLSLQGHDVSIYNRTPKNVESIRRDGCIKVTGTIEGCAELPLVTDSMKKAVQGRDVIMVTTSASGHEDIAKDLAPHLQENQIVILNPGRTLGSLFFSNILRSQGRDNVVAESQTILYTTRYKDEETRIFAIKNDVPLAAYPSSRTGDVIDAIKDPFPQFSSATDILQIGLSNVGSILHPAPTLMNIGWIENPKTPFKYYYEGITPTIAGFLEQMDSERIALAKKLGYEVDTVKDWLSRAYGAKGDNLWEALRNNKAYALIDAPESVDHRYVNEDVPTGLVPLHCLGNLVESPTPHIDLMVSLASRIARKDFLTTGRNLDNLGLKGKNTEEILDCIRNG